MQVAFYLAGEITQVLVAIPWVRCASGNVLFQKYICQVLPDSAPSQNPPPTHPLIPQSLVFSLVLHRWFTCHKVTQWVIPTLSLYIVDSLAPSHWVMPTLSLNLVDFLAPSHYPTLWSLNPVVSLAPSHYPSPAQPFPFPLRCSSPCFFLLLFLLSFIACAWKEDWSTQVLSSCQWTSLIKWQGGHHHFCMTISFYCNPSIPHWATACFPPPMLTALPVTNLVDSGNISFIVYIYWSINHLVGML